jgi:hypothetical protein
VGVVRLMGWRLVGVLGGPVRPETRTTAVRFGMARWRRSKEGEMPRRRHTTNRIPGARIAGASVMTAALVWVAAIASAMQLSPWGQAVRADSVPGTSTELNTPHLEGCPYQSPDGLSLFIASNRPGGLGGLDIWVAHRSGPDAPWGAPENLGAPVNSEADDFCPTPVRGKGLYFVSARPGGCGGPDIYFVRRNPAHGWEEPQNLGCHVNSPAGEASPSFFDADGETALYFSSNRPGGFAPDGPGPADSDIYMAPMLGDGTFGPAVLAPGLNTAAEDARPMVRKDGLEIVFDSTRPGTLGGPDIYAATRSSVGTPWSTPVNLGPTINTAAAETRASLSWDGLTLFFGSNRSSSTLGPDGVTFSSDIYVATRQRTTGKG